MKPSSTLGRQRLWLALVASLALFATALFGSAGASAQSSERGPLEKTPYDFQAQPPTLTNADALIRPNGNLRITPEAAGVFGANFQTETPGVVSLSLGSSASDGDETPTIAVEARASGKAIASVVMSPQGDDLWGMWPTEQDVRPPTAAITMYRSGEVVGSTDAAEAMIDASGADHVTLAPMRVGDIRNVSFSAPVMAIVDGAQIEIDSLNFIDPGLNPVSGLRVKGENVNGIDIVSLALFLPGFEPGPPGGDDNPPDDNPPGGDDNPPDGNPPGGDDNPPDGGPDGPGQNQTCMGLAITVNLNIPGQVPTINADVILGTPGPDVIDGLAGNDVICAGRGNDVVRGGPGNDIVIGGKGRDKIRGNGGNDDLFGQRGNDKLFGGNGDDNLDGGLGTNDRCNGGAHPNGDTAVACETVTNVP